MKWLTPFFTEAERAPVEQAVRLHHACLVADPKLSQIFAAVKGVMVRYDFAEVTQVKVEKLPALITMPAIVDREPQPGKWGDTVRVRDILRIEWKGQQRIPTLTGDEFGIATLVNYIVGVGLASGARQLTYTPDGKTQPRPFSRRVDVPTVTTDPVFMNDAGDSILDYYIDFDFPISLINNGWQAEAALSGT